MSRFKPAVVSAVVGAFIGSILLMPSPCYAWGALTSLNAAEYLESLWLQNKQNLWLIPHQQDFYLGVLTTYAPSTGTQHTDRLKSSWYLNKIQKSVASNQDKAFYLGLKLGTVLGHTTVQPQMDAYFSRLSIERFYPTLTHGLGIYAQSNYTLIKRSTQLDLAIPVKSFLLRFYQDHKLLAEKQQTTTIDKDTIKGYFFGRLKPYRTLSGLIEASVPN
jgi:hypothetical protein